MDIVEKEYYANVIFGILGVVFNIFAYLQNDTLIFVMGAGLFFISIIISFLMIKKYKNVNSQKMITYLFFGSRYNHFNFLPKIMLFMDYFNKLNNEEIDCVVISSDVYKDYAELSWDFTGIHNYTSQKITEYYFYTGNDLGTMETPKIKFIDNNQETVFNVQKVIYNNGIKCIPFGFTNALDPKEKKKA